MKFLLSFKQHIYPKNEKGFRFTKLFPAIAYIVLLMSEKHLYFVFILIKKNISSLWIVKIIIFSEQLVMLLRY